MQMLFFHRGSFIPYVISIFYFINQWVKILSPLFDNLKFLFQRNWNFMTFQSETKEWYIFNVTRVNVKYINNQIIIILLTVLYEKPFQVRQPEATTVFLKVMGIAALWRELELVSLFPLEKC